MSQKHTPAPWSRSWVSGALRHINRNVDYDNFWSPDDGEDSETANIPSYYGDTGDVDLIAAAPELLGALIELLDDWKGWVTGVPDHPSHGAGNRARAAIAKATGEPVTV